MNRLNQLRYEPVSTYSAYLWRDDTLIAFLGKDVMEQHSGWFLRSLVGDGDFYGHWYADTLQAIASFIDVLNKEENAQSNS